MTSSLRFGNVIRYTGPQAKKDAQQFCEAHAAVYGEVQKINPAIGSNRFLPTGWPVPSAEGVDYYVVTGDDDLATAHALDKIYTDAQDKDVKERAYRRFVGFLKRRAGELVLDDFDLSERKP